MLVEHSHQRVDWRTPPSIVQIARQVLGQLDLDPATTFKANGGPLGVGATSIYTAEGLEFPWSGRVFCNPPTPATLWWAKAVEEFLVGRAEAVFFVWFSINGLQTSIAPPRLWNDRVGPWLSALDMVYYVPAKRVAYLHPDTLEPCKSPPKPSVLSLLTRSNKQAAKFRLACDDWAIREQGLFGRGGGFAWSQAPTQGARVAEEIRAITSSGQRR